MEDQSTNSWIDVLGSMAFTPVKNDMVGNIKVSTSHPPLRSPFRDSQTDGNKKVRDRQLAAPGESETLQSLVINELKTKKHTAAEGLLWLTRSVFLKTDMCVIHTGADIYTVAVLTSPPKPSSTISKTPLTNSPPPSATRTATLSNPTTRSW